MRFITGEFGASALGVGSQPKRRVDNLSPRVERTVRRRAVVVGGRRLEGCERGDRVGRRGDDRVVDGGSDGLERLELRQRRGGYATPARAHPARAFGVVDPAREVRVHVLEAPDAAEALARE